ncbi:gluconokinase [Oryzifoliimicrobium ureilyticus]|uniref:gluconokinase n=1 Tax=Oryzifoliimicrobium ureilyticus TaxID=3113724 RepID=UPI0030766585
MPDTQPQAFAIIVMGVSGSGKTSIGEEIARRLNMAFLEGDSLHPAANIEKMSKGIPLDDEDRMPWLDKIGEQMKSSLNRGESLIVSCSALKRIYRERLRAAAGGKLSFVYLDGSKALLTDRMKHRTGHFMPVSLLESQLNTLEVPTGEPGVVTVDIDASVPEIAASAVQQLEKVGVH